MQDFQPIPGLAGRIFASSGSDVARRGFPSSSTPQQESPQAPTKCPRCDSANTKFCYYNNYNLSQPRHFCKSCRRYWTKGGILRNVPVGGGCRKNSKRSSKSSSKPDSKSRRKAAESGSSSESSSTLTAPNLNPEPGTDPNLVLEAPVFLGAAAGFGGLIGAADQAQGGFNFSDPGLLSGYPVGDPEQRRKAREGEAAVDLQVGKGVNGSGLDWGGSLFDIASSVDPSAYWNQNHWGDSDPSLFLP